MKEESGKSSFPLDACKTSVHINPFSFVRTKDPMLGTPSKEEVHFAHGFNSENPRQGSPIFLACGGDIS